MTKFKVGDRLVEVLNEEQTLDGNIPSHFIITGLDDERYTYTVINYAKNEPPNILKDYSFPISAFEENMRLLTKLEKALK